MAKELTPEEQLKKDYDDAKQRASQGGGNIFITPTEGDNVYAFLQGWKDDAPWYRKVALHFGLYPKNEKIGLYCLQANRDETCPPCKLVDKLFAKGDKDSVAKAKRWRSRTTYYSNVKVISTPNGEAEGQVRVYRYGPSVFTQVVELGPLGKWKNITDPKNCRPLTVKRTGSGQFDTDYNVLPEPDTVVIDKETLKKIHDLDDDQGVVEVFSADELESLMDGSADIDEIRTSREDDGASKKGGGKEKPSSGKGAAAEASERTNGALPTPDKKMLKEVFKFAAEHDVDIEGSTPDEIWVKFMEETDGQKVKGFGDDVALLKKLGADVSGKLVEWPKGDGGDAGGGDDDDSIEAQMEALRKQREKAKSGKK